MYHLRRLGTSSSSPAALISARTRYSFRRYMARTSVNKRPADGAISGRIGFGEARMNGSKDMKGTKPHGICWKTLGTNGWWLGDGVDVCVVRSGGVCGGNEKPALLFNNYILLLEMKHTPLTNCPNSNLAKKRISKFLGPNKRHHIISFKNGARSVQNPTPTLSLAGKLPIQ